jgi:drug/metabolite transporter (DMT)-like permease
VIFWGISFPLTKGLLEYLGPFSIAFIRWTISALFLVFRLIRVRDGTGNAPLGQLSLAARLLVDDWPSVLWIALTGVTLFYAGENVALRYTTATNASVLSNLTSIFMVLIGLIWLRERPSAAEWLAAALAFGGAALVSQGSGHFSLSSSGLLGDLLMVLVSLSGAAYSIGSKQLVASWPAEAIITAVAAVGAVGLLPLALLEGLRLDLPLSAWGMLFTLGIGGGALANLWWIIILGQTTTARASLIIYFVPLVSTTLAVTLLDEPLTWILVLGGAMVLAGMAMADRSSRRAQTAPSVEKLRSRISED